jgi:hypothetical protein
VHSRQGVKKRKTRRTPELPTQRVPPELQEPRERVEPRASPPQVVRQRAPLPASPRGSPIAATTSTRPSVLPACPPAARTNERHALATQAASALALALALASVSRAEVAPAVATAPSSGCDRRQRMGYEGRLAKLLHAPMSANRMVPQKAAGLPKNQQNPTNPTTMRKKKRKKQRRPAHSIDVARAEGPASPTSIAQAPRERVKPRCPRELRTPA